MFTPAAELILFILQLWLPPKYFIISDCNSKQSREMVPSFFDAPEQVGLLNWWIIQGLLSHKKLTL